MICIPNAHFTPEPVPGRERVPRRIVSEGDFGAFLDLPFTSH